jgi:hypothetical protein
MKYISKSAIKILVILVILEILCVFFDIEFLSMIIFYSILIIVLVSRKLPINPIESKAVITSMVDGIVTGIDRVGDKVCVRISSGLFDSGIIRTPSLCKISKIKKRNGLYLSSMSLLKELNEKYIFSFDCLRQIDIEILPTSFSFGGLMISSCIGDELTFGDEIGFSISCDVLIYLDDDILLKIGIGDKVKASESIIASI